MKISYFLGLALAVLVAGTWVGRVAWQAHKNLVTLHVRAMPLTKVMQKLERQTWETIETDSRLDTLVTLSVDNMPLTEVLERIGDQAGAVLTTVHAVYSKTEALQNLKVAFRHGQASQPKGWTNVAPRLSLTEGSPDLPPPPDGDDGTSPRGVTLDHDVIVRRGAGRQEPSGGGTVIRFRGGRSRDGSMHQEVIMPERIVLESELNPRWHTEDLPAPDRPTALALARQVRGRCTTFYALQKSVASSLGAGALHYFRSGGPGPGPERPAAAGTREPLAMASAEREARRNQVSRYFNLTPEQRAQRARSRQEHTVEAFQTSPNAALP